MEILQYVNPLSVGIGIAVFILAIITNSIRQKPNKLETILMRVFAGSAIPTGIVLLFCAFKPAIIAQLEGLNVHISVAGLALLYLSFKSLFASHDSTHDTGKSHSSELSIN